MDNSRFLLKEVNNDLVGNGNTIHDLPSRSPMGYGGDALELEPVGRPVVAALVVICACAGGGFVVGMLLGPVAFMVIR